VDDAIDAIRRTLDEVKAFLAQEHPPKLSEADTKASFVEPLVKALGWAGLAAVTREYYVRNSQEFIDYVLKGSDGPLVAIEAKALQVELADKHAAQLVQYCAVEGIEWAALTNGRELQVFNAFLKGDLAAKRVLRLDLLAFNSDDEFDAISAQIQQLSRASMTAPSGVRSWMHQRRMDALVRLLLATPGSAPVRALEAALEAAEIPATTQDLVQWFRVHLAPGVIVLPSQSVTVSPTTAAPPAGAAGMVVPPAPSQPAGPSGGPDADDGAGRLRPLVVAGLLPPGTAVTLSRGGEVVIRGRIDGTGRIVVGGAAHRSPSDRAFARALGRQALNGWTAWRAELPGGAVPLDALRARLVGEAEGDTVTG